jgi:hypothetical protein
VNHQKNEYSRTEFNAITNQFERITTNHVEGANRSIKALIHEVYNCVSPDYLSFYINRIIFNHSFKANNFFQAFDALTKCLPPLNEKVHRHFTRKNRKNNHNNFNQAA